MSIDLPRVPLAETLPPGLRSTAADAAAGRWAAVADRLDAVMPHLESPDQPRLWSLYARSLARTCRMREAVSAVRRALLCDPADAEAWTLLGELLHTTGREQEALDAFREATTLDPTSALAWEHRGLVCRVMGRADEARACCERAVAADPNLVGPWRELAAVLREQGEPEAAVHCYHAVLALDPSREDAWCELILVHLRAYDFVGARGTWRRAARQAAGLAERLGRRVDVAMGWEPGRTETQLAAEA